MNGSSLAAVAREVRRGERSAGELVASSLERIAATAESVNAVVAGDPDAVLAAAAEVDRGRRGGALAGLPLLVKDTEDAAGLPTRCGSTLLRDAPPASEDSAVVAALRREGAIVVGKASTSEFAWEGHGWSPLHGATRNPWNPDLSPGGSSAGSAAALAAGLAAIATASDVGGSVRTPAAQCGLLGLKPSNGTLAVEDQPGALDQLVPGILAAGPADLRLLFELLVGAARPTPDAPLPPPRTLLVCPRIVGEEPLDPAVAAAFVRALPNIERLAESFGANVEAGGPVVADPRADEDPLTNIALDLVQFLGRDRLRAHTEDLDPSLRAGIESVDGYRLEDYLALRRRRRGFREQLDRVLQGTLIVTPTLAIRGITAAGIPLGADSERGAIPQSTTNTNLHNWTGHPALSLPAGTIDEVGIPFGLQLTAPRGADSLLLEAADRWFDLAPWPHPAPGFTPWDQL